MEDDVGELGFLGLVDEIGSAQAVRPIRMSSGPSFRNEKPRSGSSICIEDTPISSTTRSACASPSVGQLRVEVAEAARDRAAGALRPRRRVPAPPAIAERITIDADHAQVRLGGEHGPGIAAGAEGPVDDEAARGDEGGQHLGQQHRDVAASRSRSRIAVQDPAGGIFRRPRRSWVPHLRRIGRRRRGRGARRGRGESARASHGAWARPRHRGTDGFGIRIALRPKPHPDGTCIAAERPAIRKSPLTG